MILTLGVAADANIVIFERIKEEARAGRVDPGRDLQRLRQGPAHDHRRERRHDRRRVHPVHARHGGRQGLRVHAGDRHASSRCSPPCSATSAILGAMARTRLLAVGASRSAWARRARGPALALRLHGQVEVVLLRCSGVILVSARWRSPASASTSASTSSPARGSRRRSPARRPSTRSATRSSPLGYGDAKIQAGRRPRAGRRTSSRSRRRRWSRAGGHRASDDARRRVRRRARGLLGQARSGRRSAPRSRARAIIAVIASLLLISIYIGAALRGRSSSVPVLIAIAHDILITGGRLRPCRSGGDDVDGRGAAHDLGLLALRHDHRVRPNPRERAAHAARDLLADRQPLDVRGADALARDQLLDPDAGRRAADLRRRDAAGLRVRAARRRRLRRLLVDLHRRARC